MQKSKYDGIFKMMFRFPVNLEALKRAFSFSFSSILASHADYRCKLVPKLRFPVPRSPFPVPRSVFPLFSNILCLPVKMAVKAVIRSILRCAASQNNILRT